MLDMSLLLIPCKVSLRLRKDLESEHENGSLLHREDLIRVLYHNLYHKVGSFFNQTVSFLQLGLRTWL